MKISFSYSSDQYKIIDEVSIVNWVKKVISNENKRLGTISYNFIGEEEILKINKDHLNHDFFTDIITFDSSFINIINGDILISPDTVKTNSQIFNVSHLEELHRVIIHGIMHLCGYNDNTSDEKSKMRSLEDKYLSYLEKL